jgi:glycosyltransferase involved in cell wall biosynthesis
MGEFSHANQHVLKQLQSRFPQLEAQVIDVSQLRVIRVSRLPRFALAVTAQFGPTAWHGRAQFHRHIVKTRYYFSAARRDLMKQLTPGDYAFTFQTQSMIDASSPGTPHFIYTDHTHLENLKYPMSTAATPVSYRWARLEQSVYRNASMVFTMSHNISRSLIEEYECPPDKIACVYAGSNVTSVASGAIDSSRFSNKEILFVGVDWERKGGPVLLEAFRSVRQTHPDAKLTIVGCSPRIHEPGVDIRGRVPLGEVADYYRRATVFCLPTLNEPFGFVFLEAFAYGLPIVATRLGAIPEIVTEGESGYLVPPLDSVQLAERLKQLLGDPQRCAEFGAHGLKRVEECYSWEATGQRMASHIERLCSMTTAAAPRAAAPIVTPLVSRET